MNPAEALNTRPRDGRNTILVVDDESGIREFLTLYLQSKDFEVLTASGSDEAIRLWHESPRRISLLITDIIMPGMNGKDLADHLRSLQPDLKVVFMSGHLPEELAEETLNGIFFKKPFQPRELLTAIEQALH